MKLNHAILTMGWTAFATVIIQTYPAILADRVQAVRFPSGAAVSTTDGPQAKNQEYYDPHQSGNPLLDVSGANADKQLSKNFKAGEFAHSGSKRFAKARIDPELVKCLQKIRDHVGKPVVINSGYRSFLYNKKLYEDKGQKPTVSRHISGQAADIKIQGMSGFEIAKAAMDAYGTEIGVGVGEGYAHIDVRGKYARWTYFSGEEDKAMIRALDAYRQKVKK